MRDLQRSVASYARVGVECGDFRAPSALDPAAYVCERGNYETDLAAVQLRTFDLVGFFPSLFSVRVRSFPSAEAKRLKRVESKIFS